MEYAYNGHLIDNKRVDLVAEEIIATYPQVSLIEAKEIAMLEGSISTPCNIDIIFNRLYNTMLIMSYNKNIVATIYQDLLMELEKYPNVSDIYYNITTAIGDYLMNIRPFPYLEEFMEAIWKF